MPEPKIQFLTSRAYVWSASDPELSPCSESPIDEVELEKGRNQEERVKSEETARSRGHRREVSQQKYGS